MQHSIVFKSLLNEESRIDSEYYTPDNLVRDEAVKKSQYKLLGDICTITAGPFGSTVTTDRYDPESVCRYIRGKDIQSFFVETNDSVFVDRHLFHDLSQFHVKAEDILITVVGMKFGKTAIIYGEDCPAIFSCKSTLLRNSKVNIYYLVTYLSSNVGYGLLRRGQRGAAQPGINLFDIRNVPVPIFSKDFQSEIASLVCRARLCIVESSDVYQKAQQLLLSELGLSDWQPKQRLTFVKKYSDADKAARFDAEYFQPKYDEIVKAIKSYPGGHSFVGKEFKQNKSVFKPNAAQTYHYVEIGSINVSTGEIATSEVVGAELPANAKRIIKKNEVIVSKVRTYRGAMAIVDYDSLIGSGAFTVLRENGKINKETLLAFLRSKPLLAWSLKPNTGTSYPVILDDDILQLPIPLFSEDTQNDVKLKINESLNLRKQSRHLLECAKRAVEIAIEQDEDAAIKLLDQAEGGMGSAN